jgi:hypothetical protein
MTVAFVIKMLSLAGLGVEGLVHATAAERQDVTMSDRMGRLSDTGAGIRVSGLRLGTTITAIATAKQNYNYNDNCQTGWEV